MSSGSIDSPVASENESIRALIEARDWTIVYIETAMRPISIKEACAETSWDRAHRSGLQHALNAIRVEFAKAETVLANVNL